MSTKKKIVWCKRCETGLVLLPTGLLPEHEAGGLVCPWSGTKNFAGTRKVKGKKAKNRGKRENPGKDRLKCPYCRVVLKEHTTGMAEVVEGYSCKQCQAFFAPGAAEAHRKAKGKKAKNRENPRSRVVPHVVGPEGKVRISKKEGVFRIWRPSYIDDPPAYYTGDADDAVMTAAEMAGLAPVRGPKGARPNPAAFVKTKRDERLWEAAKKSYEAAVARGQKIKDKWPYVTDVFFRMKERLGGPQKTPKREKPITFTKTLKAANAAFGVRKGDKGTVVGEKGALLLVRLSDGATVAVSRDAVK